MLWTLTVRHPQTFEVLEIVPDLQNMKAVLGEVTRILDTAGFESQITLLHLCGISSPSCSSEPSRRKLKVISQIVQLEKKYHRKAPKGKDTSSFEQFSPALIEA
jgi:hypothetical protein